MDIVQTISNNSPTKFAYILMIDNFIKVVVVVVLWKVVE